MKTGKTFIIAEAGVNHNGDIRLALKLVEAAYAAGADAVKFQTFRAANLVTASAVQADYQKANTGRDESQLAMLQRLELDYPSHHQLLKRCRELGIMFLSTAFDSESLYFLVNELQVGMLKIPSGEITNAPLVLEHARMGKPLIVSTGMATMADIESVLGVIAFGLTESPGARPNEEAFSRAFRSAAGRQALLDNVTLLHCTTEYPAPIDEINLRAMDVMAETFDLPVGYSDHSEGILVPVAAAARGATMIEKHFTLDKAMEGPDHKASLEPGELKAMVESIRLVEKALGEGVKEPQPSELKNMAIARKSIIAAKPIAAGDTLTEQNLVIKRPGTGMHPVNFWKLLGTKASKAYREGDCLDECC